MTRPTTPAGTLLPKNLRVLYVEDGRPRARSVVEPDQPGAGVIDDGRMVYFRPRLDAAGVLAFDTLPAIEFEAELRGYLERRNKRHG